MFRSFALILFSTLTIWCNAQHDSLTIIPYDSLFNKLEPELTEISESEFSAYQAAGKSNCAINSGYFINGSGLDFKDTCHEICESFLVDSATGKKLLLPSGYDQGIIGINISPTCTQFIVYSSYDGPDYHNYYSHRAEIYGFTVRQGTGLEIIVPSFSFYTQVWSIEEVIWVGDHSIALRVYVETELWPDTI